MMSEAEKKYRWTFGEFFPVRYFTGSQEEMDKEIERCIRENKKYEVKLEKGLTY